MTNHIAFVQFRTAVRRKGALAFCLALCMLGLALSASAREPSIITFDAPGADKGDAGDGTLAYVINDQGVIMGWYVDASTLHHSFLRTPDGRFTTFEDPVAATGSTCQGTSAWGMNDLGAITGIYTDANNVWHSFLRAPDGKFTNFDAPGAGSTGAVCGGQGTLAGTINAAGTIGGGYVDSDWVYHGYVRAPDGKITIYDPPGSLGTYGTLGTTEINPEGAIAAYFCDAVTCHGYLRAPDGTISVLDVPVSWAAQNTIAVSINPAWVITGYYGDANGVPHGFLRTPDGTYTRFDVPGAGATPGTGQGTYPNDINSAGAITGNYYDSNSVAHGFLRTPDGRFTTFDAPGAGTVVGSFQGTFPSTINSAGAITGSYTDANGVSHGFLRPAMP
jgi:hypothetical protein